MSTRFFTNREGNTLLSKFCGVFNDRDGLYAFHAITGFFRSSGYFAIREQLLRLGEVKILVGIEADRLSAEAKRRGLLYFADPERVKAAFMKEAQKDIAEAGYTKEIEEGILHFLQDIVDEKIKIRVHKSKKLHAKIYIFLPQKFNEHNTGYVITGSSNLTGSGLGIDERSNFEFNVGLSDYDDVAFAEKEFQLLWEEGEELLPADATRIVSGTHVSQLFTPFEIYIKLLIEFFGKNIIYDPETVGDLPKNFKKLSYQVDAVNQGYQMLERYNGFMLADVVGLGKTVIAAMVAKRVKIANGPTTKILVVYPPHLAKNWIDTFRQFGLDKDTKFVSNGSLHKVLQKDSMDYWPAEEYDLILVDEAHKFRNHKSDMFNRLQLICKTPRAVEGGLPGRQKKVVLISATPLNNRPEDIYYQLQLFLNKTRSQHPITNLQAFFAPRIRQYKEVLAASRQSGKPDLEALRRIYSDIRLKVLEPITVRRTRRDLKNYPDYLKDLEDQGIKFPEIDAPQSAMYYMGPALEGLFLKTIDALVNGITYSRYQAIAYLHEGIQKQYYTQAQTVARALAYIMMTGLVKRLESSFAAFRVSLSRFKTATERMITQYERGKIFVAPKLKINELMDAGVEEEEIEERIYRLSEEDPSNQVFSPDDFSPEFIDRLRADLALITPLCKEWSAIVEDPKWDEFKKLLQNVVLRKDLNPTGQLVVFTESRETQIYLAARLQDEGYQRLLSIDAANRKALQATIQENFDANYSGIWKTDIDFLITTEVLAEGINLHRANVLINYDTPWNATRLMQRLGRINRIGSKSTVRSWSFYPSRQSDDLIRLYNNAFIKLQGFHSAYGEDSRIYTPEEVLEEVKLHIKGLPEEEDKRLKYLEFIRKYKAENEAEFKRISKLPLRARTARGENVKDGLASCSLVFLKNDYKMEFYKVNASGQPEPLNFIEAAPLFEAKRNEVPEKIPPYHHDQVNAATKRFSEEMLTQTTESVGGDTADAQAKRAQKFIREIRADTKDEKLITSLNLLYDLLDVGVYTNLAAEVNAIRLKEDKQKIIRSKSQNLLMALSVKYRQADGENESSEDDLPLPSEAAEEPKIIISESFLP
jgi:superfamily II DNA or RNA helicase